MCEVEGLSVAPHLEGSLGPQHQQPTPDQQPTTTATQPYHLSVEPRGFVGEGQEGSGWRGFEGMSGWGLGEAACREALDPPGHISYRRAESSGVGGGGRGGRVIGPLGGGLIKVCGGIGAVGTSHLQGFSSPF